MKTIKGRWLHVLQLAILILITTAGSAQLHADFTATPLTGCPPMVVRFNDSSTGKPVSWKWDLGNGTTSFLQNPIATYFTPGTYNVKLLVSNATGKDSIAKSQYIVVNALPVALFSASDTTGCFPLKVQFKDSSLAGSGTLEKWQWDFGDGTLSAERNPSHTYTSPGTFTVILRVTNSNGCSAVITKTSLIMISDGVKAGFSFVLVPGCDAPAPVNFINESVGTGSLSYLWDFGDGKTSAAPNPTNNYNGGIYTVKLIAKNSFGCTDTVVKVKAVNVGMIHADFVSDSTVCAGSNLALSNTSTPPTFTSVSWYFGDGGTSTQTNPGRVYANAGTYKLKLVTSFGACKDSIVKTITVFPQPTAAFTASNTSGCAGPLNVTFQNTSANAVSYQWSFGDGSSSTAKNPVHSYTSPGTYSVTLTITNAQGCTATMVKDNLVKFIPLKIQSIDNLGVKDCLPVTISPVAVIGNNMTASTYSWDFGDGSVSNAATPSHTYTTAGVYDVRLIITGTAGCADTLIYREAVKAGKKPGTQFSADPRDVCAMLPVNFTDLSASSKPDQWMWAFGDGGTSTVQNPIYTYSDTGYFNVTLITTNIGCSDTLKIDKYIHVKPPIAKFDTSYLCSEPFKRNFLDNSLGATTWDWNFGDGSTSNDQNPVHTFSGAGTYVVGLTVSNGACKHATKHDVIVIKEHGTLAISDTITCINSQMTFDVKNLNEANISSFSWFVDGIPGNSVVTSAKTLNWAFTTPGNRPSAVVVTDLLQCKDTLYTPANIISYGPSAFFGSVASNTCLGSTVNFLDSTKTDGLHPIEKYVWDYGESAPETYTSAPFSHNYSAIGSYNVKMIVTDSYGCRDSVTRQHFVNITKPFAKFTPSDTALCPALPITFTNSSTGSGANAQWNFGDGTTSNDFSPVHAFAKSGSYRVTLLMIDVNGCTAADSATINIYSAKADFVMSDSFSTCPPLVVNITNKSANYISLNWDFGDGGNSQLTDPSHIYTYPGNFTVKLTVKNNGGCIDEMTKSVVIKGPTGTFDYSPKQVCNPGDVNYTISAKNTVSYVWDFNDGATIFTTPPSASHKYLNPGIYLPRVILEDKFGCKVAVQGLDTIFVYAVNTNILSSTKVLCDSGFVAFSDSSSSNDNLKSFLWNFGDGKTSTLRNPTHSFPDTGYYSVKLVTTTAFGCQDSAYSKNYIKVISSPLIKITGDSSACEPARIQLAGGLVRSDTSAISWAWNFDNGQVSNKQVPDSQTYGFAGVYRVSLKATNSDGCSNITSKTVNIHPNPIVDAGADAAICRFDTYTLKATGAESYTWRAHPTLSCISCATPVAKPDSMLTYYVTGKTAFGCTARDSVTITVQQPFKMTVPKGDTVCKGETVTLNVKGADTYQWSPSLWLNTTTGSSLKARPDTSITYQVIGADNRGCFKDTQSVRIKVYPLPVVDILNGDNITMQVGSSIKINTKGSADIISWKWFPAQWLSCASCPEPQASPKDQITYSVTVTNDGECTATDKVSVKVICNNANVFIPNTFSPNADGVNDVFYLRGSGLFNILSFKVFNRWGEIVFQKSGCSANNPSEGWDGTLNGQPLQPDVYVYLIEVVCANNTVFPFKGNVTLIR